jgi:hypothetical protein
MRAWVHFETVTRDENGDTMEGDYGYVTADGDYFSMQGVTGDDAHDVKNAMAVKDWRDWWRDAEMISDIAAWVEEQAWPFDDVDWRDGEALFYRADLPDVRDDTPYVRSVAIAGRKYDVDRVCRVLNVR